MPVSSTISDLQNVMSCAHSRRDGFACFWLHCWACHQGSFSVQDVSRVTEMGSFFSKQEPWSPPRGEAVFHGPKQGTPGILASPAMWTIFLKNLFGTSVSVTPWITPVWCSVA